MQLKDAAESKQHDGKVELPLCVFDLLKCAMLFQI